MDPIFKKAMAAARAGHPALLAGFGLERYVVYGAGLAPSGRAYEERLSITGNGEVHFATVRSISDASGDPIGQFAGQVTKEEIAELLDLLEAVGLFEIPPVRLEPMDMRIRITLMLGGMQLVKFIGGNNAELFEPLFPFLDRLQKIEQRAKQNPIRSLAVELSMPAPVPGRQIIPARLRFVNTGREPYWIPHPRTLNQTVYDERCSLYYGRRPKLEEGVTPLPIEVQEMPLLAPEESGIQFVWLAPGGSQTVELRTEVDCPEPGEYLARAVYSNYFGEDTIAGVARLRGAVFSQELSFQVGA
ncbi:MAG: hypothetical protein FJW38_00840 [Acidobacteria bacterium]|nr:hypothetical protein [Acidobacteriota bacterium]